MLLAAAPTRGLDELTGKAPANSKAEYMPKFATFFMCETAMPAETAGLREPAR